MRHALGTLALSTALVLLAGCGGEEADTADDPAPTASSSTSESGPPAETPDPETPDPETSDPETADPDVDHLVVALLSAPAAGGASSTRLAPVGEADELAEFLTQFTSTDLQDDLRAAVTGHRPSPGTELVAATVAVGCDVPPGVAVTRADDGFAVSPQKVVDPLTECFAPVTTVAVVEVPSD